MDERQRSLKKWTEQDWQYSDKNAEQKPRQSRGRYLPRKAWAKLSDSEKAAANRRKRGSYGKSKRYAGAELKAYRSAT
jgi:hypothetical protein